MRRDVIVAAALLLLAVASAAGVWTLEGGARNFPITMAGLLGVGAVILMARSLAGNPSKAEAEDTPVAYGRLLIVAAITVGFVLVMPWIGFYPATFLYLAGLYCWLTAMRTVSALGLAVALTVAIYLLFGLFLAVPTPGSAIMSTLLG